MTDGLSKCNMGRLFIAISTLSVNPYSESKSVKTKVSYTVLFQSDRPVLCDRSITIDDKFIILCVITIEVSIFDCILLSMIFRQLLHLVFSVNY